MSNKNISWINLLILSISIVMIYNGCNRQADVKTLPEISTIYIKDITSSTATVQYRIQSNGGNENITSGICWSTTQNPTIELETKTYEITGDVLGFFTDSIAGLTATTLYYVRAYATNSAGTAYGNELMFKSYTGTVIDFDGNVYNTIQIGNQLWMAENLKTTKYANGDLIGTTDADISKENNPKYQWTYGDTDTYGLLYTWYAAVDSRNVCPAGWHVPREASWDDLINALGVDYQAGGKIKAIGNLKEGTGLWSHPNKGATNVSGFTALPGGTHYPGGSAYYVGHTGAFWNATEYDLLYSESCNLYHNEEYIHNSIENKKCGLSVRCVKD